ncbi:MAG: methylenetetrahydrofolate reductase, partial [Chloroflexi bacterium]|nr:methylenetetrahydrofolate reductase [Chloroflexota bacterium]
MSRFFEALESDRFLVTAELNPPKGTDLAPLLEKANSLKEMVDAFNLTDSHSSRMAMSPLAVAHLLADLGIESILQITCRDRNRIALQGDLLAAHALGASNVLCMSGDPPKNGDHPDAKPVFDLDAVGLLRAISSLQAGTDLGGKELKGV